MMIVCNAATTTSIITLNRIMLASIARRPKPRLRLPSQSTLDDVSGQGWKFLTAIKPSQIPGAGNGRFLLEAVPKGAVVCVKPTVHMATVSSLYDVTPDSTITFETTTCLERYVALNAPDHSREGVLQEMGHFVWSTDGERGYLNASTWTMNHADGDTDGLNIKHTVDVLQDGVVAVVSRAIHDLQAGAELKNNYRDFNIPRFYLDFCDAHGFKDVRSAVLEVVDAA